MQAATNREPKEPKEAADTTLPLISNQDPVVKEVKEEKPVAKERQYKTLRELQASIVCYQTQYFSTTHGLFLGRLFSIIWTKGSILSSL